MHLIDELKSPEVQWQINEHFKFAREFLREHLDDPEAHWEVTTGRAIVLLPAGVTGDLELKRANLRMAHQLAQSGRDVGSDELGTLSTRRPVCLIAKRGRREWNSSCAPGRLLRQLAESVAFRTACCRDE